MDKPFPRSYWVHENKFMAGYYPGSQFPKQCEQNMQNLLACGIRCCINLMKQTETGYDYKLFEPYEPVLKRSAADLGFEVSYYNIPITDIDIPSVQVMKDILKTINNSIYEKHQPVYLHCRGGIGRTGTVVGCWLIEMKLATPDNVFDIIRELRVSDSANYIPSPETEGQIEFVMNWSNQIW
jgi:protein-tyrosine phosphatase